MIQRFVLKFSLLLRMQAGTSFATVTAPKFRVDCLGGVHFHGTIEAPPRRLLCLGSAFT